MALRSPAGLRRAVFGRDKGVCRACRLDCTWLETLVARWTLSRAKPVAIRVRGELGLNRPWRKSFWDAEHVVPVAGGGGSCGLGNVQTLCVWCHRAKSAAEQDARDGKPVQEREGGRAVVERVLGPATAEAAALQAAGSTG